MAREIRMPSASAPRPGARECLIYMIPGNPGFVVYYEEFLTSLQALLAPTEGDFAFHVYGKDLAGFADDHEPFGPGNPPHDLESQIRLTFEDLSARRVESADAARAGRPYDFVILMGHSVGAYIALEIFHRHMNDPSSAPHLNLRHGILLFPTVTHIAFSPSGRQLDFIRTHPRLDNLLLVCILRFLALWSLDALRWVVQHAMGFSAPSAAATAAFLKSPDAVRQALHMGKDEMTQITEERWEKDLWEIPDNATGHGLGVPKFFFFFARRDHWVSDRFRDEFIDARNEHPKGKTRIVIDEGNLPHAFCTRTRSSVIVASRVKEWIEEITSRADRRLG